MIDLTIWELFKFGFFIGLGWWCSKTLFVFMIHKWIGEPIKLSKGES